MKFDCENMEKNLYLMKMYAKKNLILKNVKTKLQTSAHLYSQIRSFWSFVICSIQSTIE